jgi:HAD superfamily hydrolase (TIGR01509 family)
VKAVIFDFDGVLVDSEAHWPSVNAVLFRKLSDGKDWVMEEGALTGKSMKGVYDILRNDYGLRMEQPDYERLVWEEALHIYESVASCVPGAVECLERLKRMGATMAIASSNERRVIDLTAARLGIGGYFAAVRCQDDVLTRTKPLPDVYLRAAEAIGRQAADCVAVEDSSTGVAAAKAAGMFCIALRSSHNERQDLSAADRMIRSFDELDDAALAALLR